MQAVVLRQREHRIARSHAKARGRLETRQLFDGNEDAKGPGLAWHTFDKAARFEGEDHAVNGRWSDSEELLHVGFSWRPAMQKGVRVDVGQVLPLKRSEPVVALQARVNRSRRVDRLSCMAAVCSVN